VSAAFPPGFLWGAATAAHQVEGNNLNNDWWRLEQLAADYGVEPSGDALDSYHRYPEDMRLLAEAGFTTGSASNGPASSRSPARSPVPNSLTTGG
jgi:beta-glucosidase